MKVDKSFVSPDAGDERAAVILESIVSLAHNLGLALVAEGIETQEQVDRLGALACDYGQGFFIGEPMTAKQVADALSGMPYAASKDRTAIKALWERAATAPAELPPLPPPDDIGPLPKAPLNAAPAYEPEPEPVFAIVPEPDSGSFIDPPRLGSSPMAPRLLRPVPDAPAAGAPRKSARSSRKTPKKAAKKKR